MEKLQPKMYFGINPITIQGVAHPVKPPKKYCDSGANSVQVESVQAEQAGQNGTIMLIYASTVDSLAPTDLASKW